MKTVNLLKLAVLCVLLTPGLARADRVNNGGGLWGCVDPSGAIAHAQLVDLFEAENEFGLTLIPQPLGLAADIAATQLKSIAVSVPDLEKKLTLALSEVIKKTRYVNGVLTYVDDALFRLEPLPQACPQGKWSYVQFANYTGQDQVLIRKDVWTSPNVQELDRAALLVHEAVYLWLRRTYNDEDSIRARQIVGVLFSTLPSNEKSTRIDSIVGAVSPNQQAWACTVTNDHENNIFIGFGNSRAEAEGQVTQRCSKESKNSFFCSKSPACEEAPTSAEAWYCTNGNNHESKSFNAIGRTQLEADFQAIKACHVGSKDAFFCQRVSSCQKIK